MQSRFQLPFHKTRHFHEAQQQILLTYRHISFYISKRDSSDYNLLSIIDILKSSALNFHSSIPVELSFIKI